MSRVLNVDGKVGTSILPTEAIIRKLTAKRIFVVHRHLGSILHYDLRIEINGVLKNWAIPKGPSMNVGDRRLAILTEDLPLSYASFKGVVPEGEYGAGIVEGWDKGYLIPHSIRNSSCNDQDMLCQLNEGRLKFTLKGKKLRGVFSLVRMNTNSAHWLLVKGNDKYAVLDAYDAEHYTANKSMINKYMRSRRDI